MRFDLTVNLGHILIMAGIVLSGVATYVAARVTLNEHELRLTSVEASIKAQWSQLQAMQTSMYAIQSDVAVIRDRLERAK